VSEVEIMERLQGLSPKTEFGMVFGREMKRYMFPGSGLPVPATHMNKKAAAAFVLNLPLGQDCLVDTLLAAIRMANNSEKRHRLVIYVGSALPCRGQSDEDQMRHVLKVVTAANQEGVEIHTVAAGATPTRERMLKELAAANGGTYQRINWDAFVKSAKRSKRSR
jgi:hypothetical protein